MAKATRIALLLLALCGPAPAWGETPPPEPESLFERVRAGDPEALAHYERRFEEAQDPEEKTRVAIFLAEAGRASEVHVRFLENQAREAVHSTRPYPFAYDAEGNHTNPPVYSEEFKAWVESVSGDLEQEARIAFQEQPAALLPLMSVEGPRSDEILLAGLRSRNLMVKVQSIQVLVNHGHTDKLPAMLEAIRELPAELHQVLGLLLLQLLDERADAAARELIGDDQVYEEALSQFRPKAEPRP